MITNLIKIETNSYSGFHLWNLLEFIQHELSILNVIIIHSPFYEIRMRGSRLFSNY